MTPQEWAVKLYEDLAYNPPETWQAVIARHVKEIVTETKERCAKVAEDLSVEYRRDAQIEEAYVAQYVARDIRALE